MQPDPTALGMTARVPAPQMGALLSSTFSVWSRHLVTFTLLAALIQSPAFVAELLMARAEEAASEVILFGVLWVLLYMCLGWLTGGVLIHGVVEHFRGRPVDMRGSLIRAQQRWQSLIGVSLLSGLGVAAASLLFLIPGIILGVMWAVAVPAVVIEGCRPGEALERSTALTEGYRWHVFGMGVVVVLISTFAAMVAAALEGSGPLDLTQLLLRLFGFGLDSLSQGLAATATGVTYYALRVRAEGAEVDALAEVFD